LRIFSAPHPCRHRLANMPMMQDEEDFEVAALRKLLKSGPRTNRARPTGLADPPAPDLPADDHVQKTNRLMNLLQTHEGIDEAEPLMRKELQQREADYGFGHEHTLMSASCLAMLLQAKGSHDEALRLHQRVVEGYEMLETHGPMHVDTLNAVNNLAVLLKSLGKYNKALPLYERVLAGDEEKHGKDHPHTLDSVYNLGRLFDAVGEFGKAIPLFRRELTGCTTHYGADHAETKTSASNLANVLARSGDEAGAQAIVTEFGLVVEQAQE